MAPKIISETESYFVIDKPSFMAVEPPSRYPCLRDWLVEKKLIRPELFDDDRLGVVHRLDEETSGVVIWAKNQKACEQLKLLWKGRQVKKTYLAVVFGKIQEKITVEFGLTRRKDKGFYRLALIKSQKSRPALTNIWRLAYAIFNDNYFSLIKCQPVTGRTHQIRVHLQAIGHPILGDKYYSNKQSRLLTKKLAINRHLLHHFNLVLPSGISYTSQPPADFDAIINRFFSRVKLDQILE